MVNTTAVAKTIASNADGKCECEAMLTQMLKLKAMVAEIQVQTMGLMIVSVKVGAMVMVICLEWQSKLNGRGHSDGYG